MSGWRANREHINQRINPEIFHSSPNPGLWVKVSCELETHGVVGEVPGRQRETTGDGWLKSSRCVQSCRPDDSHPRALEELESLALTLENSGRASRTWEKCRLRTSFKNSQDREGRRGGRCLDPVNPTGPILKLAGSSIEQSLTIPSFTYFLYSSSFIFKQKVSRTLLSSCGWTRPVLLTSMSLRALITVLMFLKICV